MKYIEDTRYFSERTSLKRKCKHCGHTQPVYSMQTKVVCKWCNNFIFKNEMEEFKYRLKEKQNKEKRNKNEI